MILFTRRSFIRSARLRPRKEQAMGLARKANNEKLQYQIDRNAVILTNTLGEISAIFNTNSDKEE